MSDHIVSYWTQFRRDNKMSENKEIITILLLQVTHINEEHIA